MLNLTITPPNFLWQVYLEEAFPSYTQATPRRRQHREQRNTEEDLELSQSMLSESMMSESMMSEENATLKHWRDGNLNLANLAKKMILDCFTLGIFLNTVAFFLIMGILKGMNAVDIWNSLQKETVPMLITGYKVWPAASIIAYCFLPAERRILFFSFVGFCWGIYLSLVGSKL